MRPLCLGKQTSFDTRASPHGVGIMRSLHSRHPLPGHVRMKEPIMATHGVGLCTLPSLVSWTYAAAPALLAHPSALPWNHSSEPLPSQTPRCRRTSHYRMQYPCMRDYDVRTASRALHASVNVLMHVVMHALPRGDLAGWRLHDCISSYDRPRKECLRHALTCHCLLCRSPCEHLGSSGCWDAGPLATRRPWMPVCPALAYLCCQATPSAAARRCEA